MATRGPALERDGGETTARAELALNYGQAWTGRPHARSSRSTSKACFIECVRCTQLSDGQDIEAYAPTEAGAARDEQRNTQAAKHAFFRDIQDHRSSAIAFLVQLFRLSLTACRM